MIRLAANETLLLVAGSAVAIDCLFEFNDGATVQFTHSQATTKDVAKGPLTITRMILTNATGSAQTVTLKKSVTGQKSYQLYPTIDLAAGECVAWEPNTGLVLFDATGRQRINTA